MEREAADRLHRVVYGALRILEDTDMGNSDVGEAIEMAEELLAELKRLRGRRASRARRARSAGP
jgi:hypothetical protein